MLYQPATNDANGNPVSGSRIAVEGHYVLNANHQVGFEVAAYDHSRPLYIDPVLVYSTYLGGSKNDYGLGITVDSTGNAYITGYTNSVDFPVTAGALDTDCSYLCPNYGVHPAFVAKMNPSGKALVYATYLGSTTQGYANGNGIAVDSSGNVYLAGTTSSASFPVTTGAFQTTNRGTGSNQIVGFVTKLNPTGSSLLYSTYLGASNFVNGNAIAIDSTGNAYITGYTSAGDFPTLHPVQAGFGGTIGTTNNVFVTELNFTGTALVFSTYLGGSYNDQGAGIAVDNSGNVYVGGYTTSIDFPLLHSYQAINTSVIGLANAFAAKLNWNGTTLALVYSTILGGSNGTQGTALAADASGNVYLTGWTGSSDYPTTASAFQKTYAGGADTFIAKLSWNGSALSLAYSTFLGGSGQDQVNAIAIDSSGNAYVAGTTLSTNFPTLNAIQSTSGGGYYAFVTELNPTGSALVYSTYLGGSDPSGYGTSGYGIAVDAAGNAYVTGNTGATNFPTTASPLQSTCGGCSAGNVTVFVSKLPTATVAPSAGLSPSTLPFGSQNLLTTSASQPVTLSNTGTAALAISSIAASANFGQTNNCGTSLAIGATCTVNVTFAPTVGGPLTGTLTVTDNNNLVANSTQTVSLTGTGIIINTVGLSPATLPFGNQPLNTTSSSPQVTVLTNTGNVPITSIVVSVTGTNASAFTAFSGCGTTLAVGATCNTSVNFKPTATGGNSATLNIADSATGSPQTAALTGTGVATSVVAPAPLVFNPVAVGVSSGSAQTITATFTLNGYAAGFTPTAALHYGTSYSIGAINCTGTAGSETCTVPITFRPQYPGGRREALFLMNGPSRISTLLLYGIGQAPFALVQPGVVSNPILSNANYLYTSIIDENGTVYVLGDNSNTIYAVTKAGVVSTLPITGLNSPRGIGIDGAGVLYIAEQTFNGPTITWDTVQNVRGTVPFAAPSIYVQSISVGNTGNIYETDAANVYTVPIVGSGTASTKAINPAITQAYIMAVDSNENVFVAGYEINEITSGGVETQINTIGAGDGLGVDAADTLYATRYTGTGGVAELPASNYGTFEAALDVTAPPLGTSVGPDGTVYVGNYTNLDKVDRSQGVIAFGQIGAAVTQNVSIYNGGNQPLTITNIAIAGSGFTFVPGTTNPCTLNVAMAPGTLCQVAVTLTPPHAGTFSGSLTFTSNSLNNASSTQSVALSGAEYGTYVTASPASLNFAPQVVGTTSAAQTVTLTNSGELYNAGIGAPSPGSASFTAGLGTCTAALAPGASCNLSVTFTPQAVTSYNNILVTVPYNSSGGGAVPPPVTFTVNGTGLTAAAPAAALSPNPLAFPGTIVGATVTLPLTLSNPGTAALTVTGISVTGTNASNFTQTNNCGTSLAAAATCTITVTFTPTSTAAVNASISVADNASGSPHTAALTGTGTTFVSNVGTALTAQPVTLFFTTAGTLNSIQVLTQGTAALDFTLASGGSCATGTAYTVGQSCTVNVIFTPKFAGSRQGAVLLTDSSGNALATTNLPGTGLGPQIVFGPGVQSTMVPLNSGYVPTGVAVDGSGNLYFANSNFSAGTNGVFKMTKSGTTYGAPVAIGSGYNQPIGLTVDGSGNVYVGDSGNHRVVKIPWTGSAYGAQTTVPLDATPNRGPRQVVVDSLGNVYFADPNYGTVVEVPWTGSGYGTLVTLPFTGLNNPNGVAVDANGDVFCADTYNHRVLELPHTSSGFGSQITVATVASNQPLYLALDGSGDIYVSEGILAQIPWNGSVFGAPVTLNVTGLGYGPYGVAIDSAGNVVVGGSLSGNVLRLDRADAPSLSFAATNVGSTSTDSPQTVTVQNIGNTSLALTVPGTGTNPSYPTNFPVNSSDTSLCASGTPLAEGATCDVSVNFKPTTSGSLTGNVVHTDNQLNVSGATQSIAVSGTGNAAAAPVAALSPNPLAFPSTSVGSTATALPVTLSNTGNATLTGIAISIAGTNPSDFAATSATTCGTTLAAGTSCLIYISFTPASATSFSAALSVADNASGSPQTVTLTGTGTTAPTPQATLSPNPLAFSGTLVGTAATALPMTLSNPGTAALAISSISVTGTNASSFGQSNNCGSSLAVGANCTITVTFTPGSASSPCCGENCGTGSVDSRISCSVSKG